VLKYVAKLGIKVPCEKLTPVRRKRVPYRLWNDSNLLEKFALPLGHTIEIFRFNGEGRI
jgi:hypothetical protein